MKRPAQLPESLCRRLNSYALAASAAGVSLLALAQPAEAKIVYTQTHKTCPCEISLNNDGNYDFAIGNTSRPFRGGPGSAYPIKPLFAGNRVWGAFHTVSTFSGQWAFALRSGALITTIPKPKVPTTALLVWTCNTTGGGCFSSHFFGYWANRRGRYLGLRFTIRGKVHYGWARLTVKVITSFRPAFLTTLTGYAYETIPNKPIIAGKTKGPDVVPVQDPSLGHLARGASAIPAWRTKER